jgi:hypothetical protein
MTPGCFPPSSVIEGRMAFQSILARLRLWKETTSRKIQSRQAGQDWSSSFASNGEGTKRRSFLCRRATGEPDVHASARILVLGAGDRRCSDRRPPCRKLSTACITLC